MQLYREQGCYLERIYKWMERVGLENIRAADHGGPRSAAARCYDRFVYSQRFAQHRPLGRARRRPRRRTSSTPLADLTPARMAAE